MTGVAVGDRSLIDYTYRANNGLLSRADYGNGAYTEPIYDELDRKIGMKYNGVKSYELYYGADGRVGLLKDLENGVSFTWEKGRQLAGASRSDTLWFYYDGSGSLISFELNGTAYYYIKNLQGGHHCHS